MMAKLMRILALQDARGAIASLAPKYELYDLRRAAYMDMLMDVCDMISTLRVEVECAGLNGGK